MITTGFSVDDVMLILNTEYPGCEWSAQVVADTIEISLTERTLCEGCGQPITVTGPVTWLCHRHGDNQGGYSHQHGCGSWNTPHHSIRFHVRPLEDQLFDLVNSMAEEVLTAREAELSKRRAEIRDRLLRELAEVEGETGSEIEPGVFFVNDGDGGRWVAWAYDPDLSGDIIEVTRAGA